MTAGLGCMRLSTAPDRERENGLRVIHAALDAGVTFLDTADVYCHDHIDIGHNERLVAEALRAWSGNRSIEVATKGGMRRPNGAWVPDGRAKHLRAACEASLRALGVECIDLYQLHVPDPKVPFETSVRALAALQRDGLIRHIGLSNVNVAQIEAARRLVDVHSVQVPLSIVDDEYLRNGVAEYCRDRSIRVIAYRPLGGAKHAKRLGLAQELALAWLLDLGVLPIPGPTRPEHAAALGQLPALTQQQREELDARGNGRLLRMPRAQRRAPDDADGDVVLVMGMPGAGKSTIAEQLVRDGYERLNRDERGGRLRDLVAALDHGLATGARRFVLDNTYASRADRGDVLECAWRHGVPVRVIHADTDIADAQINAVLRMVQAHGSLPSPEDIRARGRTDHRFFGPDAQFRWVREVDLPVEDEGHKSIERRAFVRRDFEFGQKRAVFFDPAAADIEDLQKYVDEDRLLIGIAWNPDGRNLRVPGLKYDHLECTHPAGPPVCWCRKPLPGLYLEAALRFGLDLNGCIGYPPRAGGR